MTNKDFELIINKGIDNHYEKDFSVFNGHENIFLGSNIYLVNTLINAGDVDGKVTIEDYVFFGHGVKILARGHNYKLFDKLRQEQITEKPIVIKQGAWISSGSIILAGVTIGQNAVIGAGSIVTKNIPNGAIATGNPAKVIKYIDRELTIIEKIKGIFK